MRKIALVVFFSLASLSLFASSVPRLSIITSVFKGDAFIEGFLEDIVQQTIFSECELIVVNANSPGNEEPVILKYAERYPNIVYKRLDKDPGIYGVWNRAIRMARSDYIVNANLDDRSRHDSFEIHLKAIEADPSVDLVYAGYHLTQQPNQTFAGCESFCIVDPPEFSLKNMYLCLPGPRPVWRKSMHDKYGFFDEIFVSGGDLAMWLRAVDLGSKFKKIPGFLTLFYENPKGLSTDKETAREHQRQVEGDLTILRYGHVWK